MLVLAIVLAMAAANSPWQSKEWAWAA